MRLSLLDQRTWRRDSGRRRKGNRKRVTETQRERKGGECQDEPTSCMGQSHQSKNEEYPLLSFGYQYLD